MVSASDINPFANISLGGKLGSVGSILLIFVIALVIIGIIGFFIYSRHTKKQYWIIIHVFRLIGNTPTRVAVYNAKEVPFGMAGDRLWKVATGFLKMKAIKWLPVGKIQTAPREFWYYIREDGEWINFSLADLNDIQRKAGVRFVQEDMRLQRLATERLLEQRLMNKTFWEKWGTTIMLIIVFLVVAVCMVVIFYQFSKILDKFAQVTATNLQTSQILLKVFGENFLNQTLSGGTTGLIPV
ncbi:MAG TPA: hypothetical protein VMV95_00560 [Bacillota bacterium]|nr:hypothetical protein [Bacillota bacterium]